MRKYAFFLLVALILPFAFGLSGDAQGQNEIPDARQPAVQVAIPAILSFTTDLESITVAEAEAGSTIARFEWQTIGMAETHRLLLFAYEISTWVLMIDPEAEPLQPSGAVNLGVRHPLNFNPPSYRLLIVDENEVVLSERLLTIPYTVDPAAPAPQITAFTANQTSITADALAYDDPSLPVRWEISDRTPTSNLVFEQALPDGTFVSIERPRSNLWVSSLGEGGVAPVLPNGGTSVLLRLRLVDLVTGETLDESAATVTITGTVSTPTPAPTNAPRPTATPAPQGEQAAPPAQNPAPVVSAGAGGGFELGGHIASFAGADTARSAGMTWVKKQVRWQRGEGAGGAIAIINEARANGFKILLGIVGYRDQMGDFDAYIGEFAAYLGEVAAAGPDAIEVWNEPNIDREWPAGTISGANYTRMLAAAYNAIKSANPNVMVVSGAPAPTGFFGGGCAAGGCDDNIFLRQMANAGATNYMDCVGAHYNEGIISPEARSGDPRGGHYSRYFWGMLDLYYNSFGGARPVCWTELGFLTSEGYGPLPGAFGWAGNTTLAQHAEWLGQAARLSRNSGRVRLMIVWNVDFQVYDSDPQAGYAIRRPDGSCPACGTLAAAMQ